MKALNTLLLPVSLLLTGHAMSDEAAQMALGKFLFTAKSVPECVLCHTLQDAGSIGEVGPVLDDIKPHTQRVMTALKNGLGQMPSFSSTLSESDMKALALYVSKASGGYK